MVVVMGEDVGKNGGVFRATDGLFAKYGPKRVIDTPLAEAGIIGTAIGMSFAGLKPVAEIQFNAFVMPAMNQIVHHAARYRNRTRGEYNVPLVIRIPWSGGFRALEQHGESMEALFAHAPGLKVVYPSTPYDTKGLLLSAIRDPDPVIFLEPIRLYRAIKQEVPDEEYTIPIGKANVLREGTDISIITYGAMVKQAMEAAEAAAQKGVSAEVVDLRTIAPWDEETVIASVKKTGKVILLNEGQRQCGMMSEIAAVLNEVALYDLAGPIIRLTGFDVPMPLFQSEDLFIPDVSRILAAIDQAMHY
jgi:pyruvate dehydrogenase E1 component beta subunit